MEEKEEVGGEAEQDVRSHLPPPASAAAHVYRGLVSHQARVSAGEEEETKDKWRNHIQVVEKRQKTKQTRVT